MNAQKINLIGIRKQLHELPELAGDESRTTSFVRDIMEELEPDEIIDNIGGNGLAVVFKSKYPGPRVMFRAELDALPIQEKNTFNHKSKVQGISHACGHDGHMTILIGLAKQIKRMENDLMGEVVLLFQPAEETAEGAKAVLNDKKFQGLKPDYIFALHNIPGFPLGQIILRKGVFASASKGLIVRLNGVTSHAGEPEKGNSPVLALINIVEALIAIPQMFSSFDISTMITIIHLRMGEVAFGTSPDNAEIMATLRSHSDDELGKMSRKALEIVEGIARTYKIKYETQWVEYFPAIYNSSDCVKIVESAAKNLEMDIEYRNIPFSWTEDFSFYTKKFNGAFFGIGSGVKHPNIHTSNFDFPDEIIDKGIYISSEITRIILER